MTGPPLTYKAKLVGRVYALDRNRGRVLCDLVSRGVAECGWIPVAAVRGRWPNKRRMRSDEVRDELEARAAALGIAFGRWRGSVVIGAGYRGEWKRNEATAVYEVGGPGAEDAA